MSNATDNIIDIITQTSYRITDELNAIDAAVAAAVQAEREACAQTIETFDNDGEPIGKREYAAAIRARNG